MRFGTLIFLASPVAVIGAVPSFIAGTRVDLHPDIRMGVQQTFYVTKEQWDRWLETSEISPLIGMADQYIDRDSTEFPTIIDCGSRWGTAFAKFFVPTDGGESESSESLLRLCSGVLQEYDKENFFSGDLKLPRSAESFRNGCYSSRHPKVRSTVVCPKTILFSLRRCMAIDLLPSSPISEGEAKILAWELPLQLSKAPPCISENEPVTAPSVEYSSVSARWGEEPLNYSEFVCYHGGDHGSQPFTQNVIYTKVGSTNDRSIEPDEGAAKTFADNYCKRLYEFIQGEQRLKELVFGSSA
jgi:hypothetical protein